MIRGVVTAGREAVVPLTVRGPGGTELDIDAAIDTGFTGVLTLPARVASALGLEPRAVGEAILADGSMHRFEMVTAEVTWGGAVRSVLASVVGDEPLIGMGLLDGHELRVEVTPGGTVEIYPLP